jgi:hypothetical protein
VPLRLARPSPTLQRLLPRPEIDGVGADPTVHDCLPFAIQSIVSEKSLRGLIGSTGDNHWRARTVVRWPTCTQWAGALFTAGPFQRGLPAALLSSYDDPPLYRRNCTPVRLSRCGCSCQFGRASAPIIQQRVHTMRGPNDGTSGALCMRQRMPACRWRAASALRRKNTYRSVNLLTC